ncbi:MAG: ABC transporter permease [Candidatus Adiutrix intracellularis]|jgi:spermidine/putrescine transport system permease protein|nr:MAG: ABC transporter permease [Candidatus Adiutrix intracellularis]MDR2827352.1 ABC transporter permease [Candidatus Adiutrix intracellularis]
MIVQRLVVAVVAIFSLFFLYVPSLSVVVFSVNQAKYGLVWKGFSWKWYTSLFHNQIILDVALNSLVVAVISTAVATLLGTALALGMDRFPWPKRLAAAMNFLVHLPVVTPDIILAAALVLCFSLLRQLVPGFEMGLMTLIIGHVTFQLSFVTLVVRSRLAALGRDIDEAARDLYASDFYLFSRVTLPLLAPGIIAGAMLAFTLSLDDFIISFFTHGPDSVTLPIYLYASIRRGISPEIHALSTLILLVTVFLVLLSERLARFRAG